LGAGAWGTALAVHLTQRSARKPSVLLWSRSEDHASALRASRQNARYLAGVALPHSISITSCLDDAANSPMLIVATPIAGLLPMVDALHAAGAVAPLAWLSKGFVDSAAVAAGVGLAHQVVATGWPTPVGVISGPSFAEEVARGLPTALVAAATDAALAADLANLVRGDALRAYDSEDIAGVEVGGAIKNVLAIAAGLCDGLSFGNNARAALITRGLAETARLSEAFGGEATTLMGLAGLGDLVLTCTGDLSRNRRVGLALAAGEALTSILPALGHVAEGVTAARAAVKLARHFRIDMPITEAVYRVLYEALPVRRAVEALLSREPKSEAA
jgi:glycerol-3-phosphate dehydrogenase (NAD(P)+)